MPQIAVENAVLDRILNVVLNAQNVERLIDLTNKELRESGASAKERTSVIANRLSGIRQRLERLYEALETGKLQLDDPAPRIQALRQEEALVQRLHTEASEAAATTHTALVDRELVLVNLKDLRGLIDEGTPSDRRAILRSFVRAVVKTGASIRIEYTLPLPPDDASLRNREGVLSIVNVGGPA